MAREPAVVRLPAREQGPLQGGQPGEDMGQTLPIPAAVGPHRHHHGRHRQAVQPHQHIRHQAGLRGERRRLLGPVGFVAPRQQHQAGGGIAVMTGQRQPLPHRPW